MRTPHAELSLDDIADQLPGTGEIMASVGTVWWKCAYAARGGNWDLADYFARRARGLQRKLAVIRPKYREDLAAFERDDLGPLFAAIHARDVSAFDRAYEAATASANRYHVKTGKSYIRWVLPDEPPRDLHLGPVTVVDGEQRV